MMYAVNALQCALKHFQTFQIFPFQLFSVQLHPLCAGEELRVRLRREDLRADPEPRPGLARPDCSGL